jgi:hypothetical protein
MRTHPYAFPAAITGVAGKKRGGGAGRQYQELEVLAIRDLGSRTWRHKGMTGHAVYDREGGGLARQGLYLDLPPWGYHVFAVSDVE